MRKLYTMLMLSFLCVNISCVKDVDFNQADQLVLTPTLDVSLVNSSITQNDLVVGGVELSTPLRDSSSITLLNSSVARENLERVVLRFEIENEFSRSFRIVFTFFDQSDMATINPIVLNVGANQTNFTQEEEIIIASNSDFLNSTRVEVSLELLPSTDGSVLDANDPRTFTFKSSGTIYFRTN
ncbi:hypothetical protein [Tenacibaculum agarivorans]|uniref:hypothetical protein n=1 Tax=Tenacibaculum agarivorans TaxID=1908389 RepID=UPI000ADF5361|nr:hypothetical protein [Tenacibaculum agarivorans]